MSQILYCIKEMYFSSLGRTFQTRIWRKVLLGETCLFGHCYFPMMTVENGTQEKSECN